MAVRRWVVIGAGVAVLASAAAAAPWVAGVQAERAVHAAAIDAAGRDVTVRALEMERGYRVTRLRGVVEVEGAPGDHYYRWAGEPLLLEVEAEVVHGPLVRSAHRGWDVAAALVRSEIQPPPRWREAAPDYFHGAPWRVESLVGRGGDVVSHFRLAGFEGAEHAWDEITGEWAMDGGGQAMFYLQTPRWAWSRGDGVESELREIRFEGAMEATRGRGRRAGGRFSAESVAYDEGAGGGRVAARGVAMALNREFRPGEGPGRIQWEMRVLDLAVEDSDGGQLEMEGVRGEADLHAGEPMWTGTFSLGGDRYTTRPAAALPGAEPVRFGPWRLGGEAVEAEGLADLRFDMEWAGDGSALSGERGESRLVLSRIHAGALADLSRALWSTWPTGDTFAMGFAVGERLLARTPDLLEAKPEIALDVWQEGPDGVAEVHAEAAYDGPGNLGPHQWPSILADVRADGRFVAPRPMVEAAAAEILLQEALEAGVAPSPELEAVARRMAKAQTDALRADGWLVEEEDGRLAATARFRSLLLTLNDRLLLDLGAEE